MQFDDDEITSEYRINNGVITNPGKFEGEPPWVPLLWDRVLSGFSDKSVHDGTMAIDAFALDDSIAALTGMRPTPGSFIALWSSDDGFVSHMIMSEDELDQCEGFDVPDFEEMEFDSGH
jgi:hypothetical protein